MPRVAVTLLALFVVGCDGSTPPPVPSLEAMIAYTIRQSACVGTPLRGVADPTGVAGPEELELLRCGVNAGTCEDFLRCLDIDPERTCAGAPSTCEGTRITDCVNTTLGPRALVRDCAETVNPICHDGLGGPTCVRSTDCGAASVTCEGDAQVLCELGGEPIEIVLPCSGGRTCLDGNCVESAEPCDEERCDGDVAVHCSGTGTVGFTEDCAAMGGACAVTGEFAECELSPGECTRGAAECEGAVARICSFAGEWQTFDCASFGATCAVIPDEGATCQL